MNVGFTARESISCVSCAAVGPGLGFAAHEGFPPPPGLPHVGACYSCIEFMERIRRARESGESLPKPDAPSSTGQGT